MTGTQDPNAKDISLEDSNSSDVTSIVTQMEEAKKLTMIREVGATPSASSNKNSGAIAILTLTGGGLAGEMMSRKDRRYSVKTYSKIASKAKRIIRK